MKLFQQVFILAILGCSAFAAPTPECITAFKAAVLQAHNQFRTAHHVPLVIEDAKITDMAMAYAKNLSDTNTFQHSFVKGYGENLAMMGGSSLPGCDVLGKQFVQMWYDENKLYDYNNPTFSYQTGHFTQVVWKDSISIGCGISIANNQAFGVCNYYPAGNILGRFATNVISI